MLLNCLIYIPLWFYSNADNGGMPDQSYIFTFHYGSILIHTCFFKFCQFCKFTFHYGSILIDEPEPDIANERDLHSTMVLF